MEFQLLAAGRCVYTETGYGEKGDSQEAFVGKRAIGTTWNVLEDIDRLPALAPELAKNPYIEDRYRIQLVGSFGNSSRPRLVLCLFTHQQRDMRSHIAPNADDHVPSGTRRQMILVGPDDKRLGLDSSNDKEQPRRIWLHGTGRPCIGLNVQGVAAGESGGSDFSALRSI